MHPFGCSFGWSWFLSNKIMQGFEFPARNKIQFIPEGFPVTSRRLRPLDSFALRMSKVLGRLLIDYYANCRGLSDRPLHPFGCSFGWSWFLSNKIMQGFEFPARNKIQFIPEGFPVTSRRLRPLDSFALRMSKVLSRLLIDYYANCRGLSGRPLHPFGAPSDEDGFCRKKRVRKALDFLHLIYCAYSRGLCGRPLDSFAAPSDESSLFL